MVPNRGVRTPKGIVSRFSGGHKELGTNVLESLKICVPHLGNLYLISATILKGRACIKTCWVIMWGEVGERDWIERTWALVIILSGHWWLACFYNLQSLVLCSSVLPNVFFFPSRDAAGNDCFSSKLCSSTTAQVSPGCGDRPRKRLTG